MKKILLLSDTHSYIDDKMLKYIQQADEVWHAGDIGSSTVTDTIKAIKPLIGVYGNIDDHSIRSEFPLDQRFTCEGMDIWITHIGGYPNKYNARVKEIMKTNPPQVFICGHSHILKVMYDKEYKHLHLNPGAVGIYGMHKVRTMLRFEIDGGQIKNLEIIELEK